MDGLRWLLLIFGVVLIAGIYLFSRRDRDRSNASPRSSESEAPGIRVEPSFNGRTDEDGDEAQGEGANANRRGATGSQSQKILTLRIVAAPNATFAGDELALSLRGIGMRHGKFGIYHRYDGNDEDRVVFSAASLVEPGSFDLANLKDQQVPGISLFMVLPGPVDAAEAFDMMIEAAKTLSQSLRAELLDESGSTLSIQRERYLREEVIEFQHSILVA